MRKLGSFAAAAAIAAGMVVAGAGTASAVDTVINGCTIVSQPTETRYTNCPQADFRGANLANVNLSYANLPGADFTGATVDRINLYKARLTDSTFANLTLSSVRMQSADLRGANLSRIAIDSAWVSFADFRGAKLTGAYLRALDGAHADFTDADLTNVNLADANVRYANFTKANLSNVDFRYSNLERAEFIGATLTGANLSDANLTRALFTGTSLVPADIHAVVDNPGDRINLPTATVTWETPEPDFEGATLGSCDPASGSKFHELGTIVTCQVKSHNTTGVTTLGYAQFVVLVAPYDAPAAGSLGSLTFGSLGS